MNDFFSRLRYRFRNFMVGRYGTDQLSRFTMFGAFVCLILNMIFRRWTSLFYWLVWALLIYSYFRMFSRNTTRRYNENTRYLELRARVTEYLRSLKYRSSHTNSRSTRGTVDYKIFRCPDCEQKVRVPRGHGKVEITCPKCSRRFTKRT